MLDIPSKRAVKEWTTPLASYAVNLYQKRPECAKFLAYFGYPALILLFPAFIALEFHLWNEIGVSILGGIYLFASVWMWRVFRIKFVRRLPANKLFTPIGAILDRPMPRNEIVLDLIRRLGETKILVVCGDSGAGKSTIVGQLLNDTLKGLNSKLQIIRFGEFTDIAVFQEELKQKLKDEGLLATNWHSAPHFKDDRRDKKPVVCLFDQFERFLKRSDDDTLQAWFKQMIEQLTALDSVSCVLVLREDYYYHLRVLKDLPGVELFRDSLHVAGISADSDNEDLGAFRAKLESVAQDMPDLIDEVIKDLNKQTKRLPVELQMVGFMLEDIFIEEGSLTVEAFRRNYGGVQGLIKGYITRYIDCTRDTQLAGAVLYALSCGNAYEVRYRLDEIAGLLHRDCDSVGEVIAPLWKGGLVRSQLENKAVADENACRRDQQSTESTLHSKEQMSKNGPFWLPHDYLADQIREMGGVLVDATLRSDISYFCDLDKRNRGEIQKLTRVKREHWVSAINICFMLVLLALGARLCLPFWYSASSSFDLFGPWWSCAASRMPKGSWWIIDPFYLPSFIASVMSALYIWRIHSNFFLEIIDDRTHKSRTWRTQKSKTWGTICFAILMILAGVFLPHAWLFFASLAGFWIAVRFQSFKKDPVPRWMENTYDDVFVVASNWTKGLMLLAAAVGLGMAMAFYWWPIPAEWLIVLFPLEFTIALVYALYMMHCFRKHATKFAGSLFLSFYDQLKLRSADHVDGA